MFSLIAAIGKNRELGKDGQLIFHIPEDMKYFKDTTTNHKVLMGRKTWDSLPSKLKNRTNIVVTRKGLEEGIKPQGMRHDTLPDHIVKHLTDFIRDHESTPEEIFVIGGGMLYWEMLKHAKKLYLTEVDASADADTFFPKFNKSDWTRKVIKEGEENGLKYAFVIYERK